MNVRTQLTNAIDTLDADGVVDLGCDAETAANDLADQIDAGTDLDHAIADLYDDGICLHDGADAIRKVLDATKESVDA